MFEWFKQFVVQGLTNTKHLQYNNCGQEKLQNYKVCSTITLEKCENSLTHKHPDIINQENQCLILKQFRLTENIEPPSI